MSEDRHAGPRSALEGAGWIGPVALFVAACAWGVLDFGFSTDTWLGLAAGRQLAEQIDWGRFHETFPRHDTFSYTFNGQPWINQNWLAYLGQYWLYERIGPAAVVYGTWLLAACIQFLVLLATWWRTRSWLAAWLAAALVGIGGRDFLEPRAAVVGLLCLAALWALVCAIEGQRERERWWPVVLLLPLLFFWSNGHGSFVFGYGLLALYCGHWAAVRLWRGPAVLAARGRQVLAIAAMAAAAAGLAIALGPFGMSNFWQPHRIATSPIFRTVSEWIPAYRHIGDVSPPMWRFWAILLAAAGGLAVLWLAGRFAPPSPFPGQAKSPAWTLFDLVAVLVCLAMTLWARRFAPLLYVVASPVLAIWVMHAAAPLAPLFRGRAAGTLKVTAALAAVALGTLTWMLARGDLARTGQAGTNLLERTRGYPSLREAARFLQENRLGVNLLAGHGDGGLVSFHAPLARVFIDARSEQVYTDAHLRRYYALFDRGTPAAEIRRTLDATATDAVLVRRTARAAAFRAALESSPDWTLAFLNPGQVLFLRSRAPALAQLGKLAREGREWRPAPDGTPAPEALAGRAMVLLNTPPAEPAAALELLRRAIDRQLTLGYAFYPVVVRLLAQTAGLEAMTDYASLQAARVMSDPALDPQARAALLALLAESRAGIEEAAKARAR